MSENQTISSFQYSIIEFIACKSITVRVLLFDQNNSPIEFKNITLDGIYYQNWSNNDNYLINFVASNLGLIITDISDSNTPIINVVEAPLLITNLCIDDDNNIIIPQGFSKNQFNIIMDETGMPIQFAILKYDALGMPDVTNRLFIGPDDRPILPDEYTRQSNGSLVNKIGEKLVIIYNKN